MSEVVAKKEEKNCWTCGYKEAIPGDTHITCKRTWKDVTPPKARVCQWYHFPLNFDPIWQKEPCKGWAKEKDPAKTMVLTPLGEVMRLLGGR